MRELEVSAQIPVQRWMVCPETLAIMAALNDKAATQPQTLFVGGCVRNALIGAEVEDIDLATVHHPDVVMHKLGATGFKVIPTGIDHGTVSAVMNGKSFEITTLRKDVETDGRHAVVAFSDNWLEDAQRRDFTMNTLLADCMGNVYDPLGRGAADAKAGKVIFAGEADLRIREDYLRILRFFRFHALYGKGAPEKAALEACKKYAGKISTLSRERITQEFFKILSGDEPQNILTLMFENNVLKDFYRSDEQMEFLKHFCMFQKRYGLIALSSRLFVLAGLDLQNVQDLAQYLMIPKVFLKDMAAIKGVLSLDDMDTDKAVRRSVYLYGRMASAQSLMIELVQDRVMNGYAPKALDIIQSWNIPDCPVRGADLMGAGFEAGPAFGEILAYIEKRWIDSDFKADKNHLLSQLAELKYL